MSTLTVSDKGVKKPQYKDYVSFLGNYKNGKKDDQCSVTTNDSGVSFSLSNSSNNSSSSVNSDLTDLPKPAFKEYLENYNNKKYSPVQPAFIKKNDDARTVKTEVYIEINNPPPTTVSQVSKVFEIKTAQNNNNTVSKVSKIFENGQVSSEGTFKSGHTNKHKVNTFNFEQSEVPTHNVVKHDQKKKSIGEISKKFEESALKSQSATEAQVVQLKKQTSIKEMSKVFQENASSNTEPKKFEAVIKKSVIQTSNVIKQQREENTSVVNGPVSPKPQINPIKPVLVPKTFTENGSSSQQKPPKPVSVKLSSNTLPPPPPPPPQPNTISPIFPSTIPPPPPFQNFNKNVSTPLQNTLPPQHQPAPTVINIPPPPPPPPADFSSKRTQSLPRNPTGFGQKTVTNGITTGLQNGRQIDGVDGTAVPVIDKNDPRVKKLVYGALREMYGAYHDKANDYIATLPRNRVKKNNGLDSIIDSIASQGGLEKLTGRVNPNVDKE